MGSLWKKEPNTSSCLTKKMSLGGKNVLQLVRSTIVQEHKMCYRRRAAQSSIDRLSQHSVHEVRQAPINDAQFMRLWQTR
jgi:hypothetical protein